MVKWNLNDIYSLEERESLIFNLKSNVDSFKEIRKTLSNDLSPEEFMRVLKKREELHALSSRLISFARLWQSENTLDSKRNAHESIISELCARAYNDLLFFALWFKDLDEEKAKKLIQFSGKYHYYLERLRAFKKFTLEEKEEQIISLEDLSGKEALVRLYGIFTDSFVFDWNGKQLTLDEISAFKQSPEREKRKASYDLVLEKYGKEQSVLGELYQDMVNNWRNENMVLRGFSSPISVRNFSNDVPDESVNVLLSIVKKNTGLFKEYFSLKSLLLGLKMDRYDWYAPFEKEEKEFSFEESKKMVLEAYKEFSPELSGLAEKIFDESHVHAFPEKGKRSGAFCYSVLNTITPYVFLNHTGKIRDVFAMAHELGHGVHSLLAKDQTNFTFHSTLPLSETASVFGELLLSKSLLKNASKEEKIAVLVRNLDDQYASITRQAFFVLFEIQAHDAISKGASAEKLNELYIQNIREQFGNMFIPDVFKHEWKYISHFYYSPFYCYAYAFGNLLVLSLYKQYQEEGESFIPKYLKLLSYGGSESPQTILNELGIDITQEAFWQKGFDLIREELEELKKLVGN